MRLDLTAEEQAVWQIDQIPERTFEIKVNKLRLEGNGKKYKFKEMVEKI